MIPRFAYSAVGPTSDDALLAAPQGITYTKIDTFPVDSITDSDLEFVMEFDNSELLVSLQLLSRPEEVSRGAVLPGSKQSGQQGFLRILDKDCDGDFSVVSLYDDSADLLELRFCEKSLSKTVLWGEHATMELSSDGEIIRLILEVRWI